jgi:hypothetical protein
LVAFVGNSVAFVFAFKTHLKLFGFPRIVAFAPVCDKLEPAPPQLESFIGVEASKSVIVMSVVGET